MMLNLMSFWNETKIYKVCLSLLLLAMVPIDCRTAHPYVSHYISKWRHNPGYKQSTAFSTKDLRDPNFPIVIPYKVTQEQILGLLDHHKIQQQELQDLSIQIPIHVKRQQVKF